MENEKVKKSGLNTEGLIGLILSIVSLVGTGIAFLQMNLVIQIIATIIGIIGFVYCRKGRKNGYDKTLPTIGLVINIVAFLFSLFVYFLFITGGVAKTAIGVAKEGGLFSSL